MKLAYETLEIWQLAMKLVDFTHSLRKQFPKEERYGLWSQLTNAVESTSLLIAEGYGRKTPPDRAHFMDQAIASNLEVKTAYQISVQKGHVTKDQFENLVSPLIEKIHFKTIAFKKYLLRDKISERSGQPPQPSVVIPRAQRSTECSDPPSAAINRGASRSPTGFTLIEVIMIVFILGIVVVVGGNLFFSVLKGASKAEITKEVKQNGDYAIGVMERMIRNAKEIKECTASSLKILNQDDKETTFVCLSQDEVLKISSNSAALTAKNVSLGSGTNCSPGSSLSFTCDQTVIPPKATISFTLYQKGTSTRPEEQAQVSFQTTVGLRTY